MTDDLDGSVVVVSSSPGAVDVPETAFEDLADDVGEAKHISAK